MNMYQNKEWLEQKYVSEGLSTLKIAEICVVNFGTIWNWLKRFDIKTRTLSEARRLRLASGMLGKHHSEETREKMSRVNKGRKISPHSVEHRKRLSETHKKKGAWVGKNNPNYKPKIEVICNYCRGAYLVTPSVKPKTKYCSIKCRNLADIGKLGWNKGLTVEQDDRIAAGKRNGRWLGGKSFEPYGLEFNDRLKEQIRKRDNFTCQIFECGKAQDSRKFPIHHIDYDKRNNKPENLITLCHSCHSTTNNNRSYWTNLFIFETSLNQDLGGM